MLQGRDVPSGEFLSEGWGWSFLAYGGDGETKEGGGERHEAVDPSSL